MKTNSNDERRSNASALSRLQHEVLAIDSLKLPAHVPKKIGDKAVQSLMRAISRTGQQITPILVDDENVIVAGFEVAAAMGELGANEVAGVKLSKMTQAETKAIMLLPAKIPERSDWDGEAVSAILQEISVEDPDALDITDFEVGEIDVTLGKDRDTNTNKLNDDNAEDSDQNFSQFPPGYVPVIRQGDVFNLGQHRIACGNSSEAEIYRLLMAGEEAAALIADPPYNIRIADNVSGLGKVKHTDFAMGVGEMNFEQFRDFLKLMLVLSATQLQAGALIYVFMDRRHLEELFKAVREAYLRLVDLAIWNKLSGGMGGLYRSQHEPCIVAQVAGGPLTNNVQISKFGRYRTNVCDFRGYNSFGRERNSAIAAHPTIKPWQMLAEIIQDCTKRGAIVLDNFVGAGSTILAAEKTNRRGYGIELEPKYVEVAIGRWEAMTGEKAVQRATGLTLDELRSERIREANVKLFCPGQ